MSVENYLPGDLCSGLIICWRKSSGEMSPGEKFLGEICDEFVLTPTLFEFSSTYRLSNERNESQM